MAMRVVRGKEKKIVDSREDHDGKHPHKQAKSEAEGDDETLSQQQQKKIK